MIFNENFDRTLWLILASDKKRRMEIAKLVSILPKELIERIQRELHDRETGVVLEKVEFSKAVRDSSGVTSLFKIKIDEKNLKIMLSRWRQFNYDLEENYELDLVPVALDIDLKSLLLDDTLDDSVYIGGYSCSNSRMSLILWNTGISVSDSVEYELYENACGNTVVQLSSDYVTDRVVDLEKMPDEMNLDDLENKKSINRLIRRKRDRL